MHIIWTIIVGLLVGVVAKIIHPGKESMGCIMTTILYLLSSTAALQALPRAYAERER